MKMQNTEMEFIAFDAADIIATSGGPYAGENKNDPNYAGLYYFYGLGSDSTAPNGEGLQIRNQGQDVTSQYLNRTSSNGANYVLRKLVNGETFGPTYTLTSSGVEGTLSSVLKENFLGDGAYTLGGKYFNSQQ